MQKIPTPQRNHQFKIVLVGGCFDILHFGHVSFLQKAKKLGDYLVVALESDANTRRLKGPGRPIHPQRKRRKILESLRFVDRVISLPAKPDYEQLVQKIKPQIVAVTKGDPNLGVKKCLADLVCAKVTILPKIPTPSTSQLVKLLKIE